MNSTGRAIKLAAVMLLMASAACNLPSGADGSESEATAAPTLEAATEIPAQPTVAPATVVLQPTLEPLGEPIPHLPDGQRIIVTHIAMVSEELGWAIGGLEGAADHVLRTRDGGWTWQDVTPPEPLPSEPDAQIASVGRFLGANNAWVVFHPLESLPAATQLRVWSTLDGGDTWQRSRPTGLAFIGSADYPPLLGFTDVQNGWLIAREGPSGMHRYSVYLLRTTDGGNEWTVAIDPFVSTQLQSCQKTGVVFADLQVGWATYDNCPLPAPEFGVTRDGGQTWQAVPLPPPASRQNLFDTDLCEARSPQLISPQEGALVVSCSTGDRLEFFYLTRDGGNTWDIFLYPGGELQLFSRQSALALGRKIYRTTDGGRSWDSVKTVEWDGQFSFVNAQLGWAVARSGAAVALVRTTNGGATWDLLKSTIGP